MADTDFHPDWTELNFNEPNDPPSTSSFLKSPAQIRSASTFLQYNKDGRSVHREVLTAVATQAAAELEGWTAWLNSAAAEDGVSFQLLFADSNSFGAKIQPTTNGGEPGHYSIIISLGCIPFLVGAANRLATMDPLAGNFPYFANRVKRNEWNPSTDPIDVLTSERGTFDLRTTRRTAVDALTLMLLHEAAHGCRGHPWVPQSIQRVIANCRALESEADWGIGYLYVLGSTNGMPTTAPALDHDSLNRFVSANLCNYLGFQSHARTSGLPSSYYLPFTRMVCAFDGVHQALFDSSRAEAEIVELLKESMARYALLEWEFPEIYPGWISHYDPRSISDLALHRKQSHRIAASLLREAFARKASPLKVEIRRY